MLCLCKSRKVMSRTLIQQLLAKKQQWIFWHHMSRIYIFVYFSHGVLGHNGFLWLYGFGKCKMDVSIDIKASREWVKFQFWLNYDPSEGTESQLSSLKKKAQAPYAERYLKMQLKVLGAENQSLLHSSSRSFIKWFSNQRRSHQR